MGRLPLPKLCSYLLRDRFLGAATVILSVVALLPLLFTRAVPLVDLPLHLGLVSQLSRLAAAEPMATEHFMLQPHPAPYWVLYLLLWCATSALGTFAGSKLVVAACALATPLGLIRLAIALKRSPRLALFGFALVWEFNQSMGFLAFTLTVGLALGFVARAVERLDSGAPLGGQWLGGAVAFAFLLANSHAHAAGVATALLGALALTELPDARRFWRFCSLAALPMLALLPWLVASQLHQVGTERDPVAVGVGEWPSVASRVGQLHDFTLQVVEHVAAKNVSGVTYLLLLLGPLVLVAVTGFDRSFRRPLALYASMWVLYLAFPEVLYRPFYQWFINTRHGTLILLTGLLLPKFPFYGRHRLWLAPGLLCCAAMSGAVAWQFARFDHEVAPFFRLLERMPRDQRINWVLWQHSTPESSLRTITGLPAYITTEKGGYTPHLFQSPNLPVVYVDEAHLDFALWYKPSEFDPVAHSRGYDYVLVQGSQRDFQAGLRERLQQLQTAGAVGVWVPPSHPGEGTDEYLVRTDDLIVRLADREGIWRLYEVQER